MDPQARIDFLADWMRPGTVGAEIGVWKGDFSRVVLDRVGPSVYFLVDPWEYKPEFPSAWYGGGRAVGQDDMDAVHNDVCTRFAEEIEAGRVVVLRSCSDAVRVTRELDWVYIDGNHTYDAVRSDIAHWSPQLTPNGLVILDDYGVQGWWEDGVTKAADEACESGLLELLAVGGSQAVFRVARD